MGTNYYLIEDTRCKCCGRGEMNERIAHIGKSSTGWYFSLHVEEKFNLNSLEEWMSFINNHNYLITDEYDSIIEKDMLLNTITKRTSKRTSRFIENYKNNYKTNDNTIELIDNKLFRSKVGKNNCISHGEGTWIMIKGDFS